MSDSGPVRKWGGASKGDLPRTRMFSVAPMLFDARIQKEARALRDAGWEVEITHVEDPRFLASLGNPEEALRNYRQATDGIRTTAVYLRSREWLWLPRSFRKLAQAAELLVKFWWAATKRPTDVVHCHDLTPGIFCLWARLLHRSALIYDAHELAVRAESGIGRALQGLYERVLVRWSDSVVTVNEEIAGLMESRYGRRVHVVGNRPPLVDPAELDRATLRSVVGAQGSERIILYSGWLGRDRGIEQVVEALRFLDSNVLFAIMGVGRAREFRAYVENLADEHGVDQKRLRFLDPVPPNEVVRYAHGADVLVALYQNIGAMNNSINAPNKLFQAIMARVPILATDNETLPKYVLHNEVGPIGAVVDPTDPARIAEGITNLLDPERQQTFRSNAERLASRVSWEEEAKHFLAIYPSAGNGQGLRSTSGADSPSRDEDR